MELILYWIRVAGTDSNDAVVFPGRQGLSSPEHSHRMLLSPPFLSVHKLTIFFVNFHVARANPFSRWIDRYIDMKKRIPPGTTLVQQSFVQKEGGEVTSFTEHK